MKSIAAGIAAVVVAVTAVVMAPSATSPAYAAGPLQCDVTPNAAYVLPPERSRVVEVSTVGDTWAGHPVAQSVLTTDDAQYVAYYNASRQMTIAKRSLPMGSWTYFTLNSTVGWDSHNSVTMALDSVGQLHVSGNMHAQTLVYFRTTTAGNINTLVPAGMTGQAESAVTYPTFITLPDGRLVFRYRSGASGNGVDYYNVYNATTSTWTRLVSTALLDGQGQRNAYADDTGPKLGPDGYFHMVWVWRETSDAATNHTISYAKSPDLLTWFAADGTPIALPITLATGDVVDPVAQGGGAINNNVRIGFDASGAPVVSYHKYDANNDSQIFVARPVGSGWSINQVTGWTGKWSFSGSGTFVFQVNVGAPVLLPDGNLRIDVTCIGAARTIIVNGSSLTQVTEIDTPPLPGGVSNTTSPAQAQFPSIRPNIYTDIKTPKSVLLRWESMPANGDVARASYPGPQPLQVITLGPATATTETDSVDFGDAASESAHSVVASSASGIGTEGGATRRYSTNGSGQYFQATMSVPAGLPAVLRIVETYGAAITREYDVVVGGQVVAHRLYTSTGPGTVSYDVDLAPATTGTGSVVVRFQPNATGNRKDPSIAEVRTFGVAATDFVDLGDALSESQHGLTGSAVSGVGTEAGTTRRYTTRVAGAYFEFTVTGIPGMEHVLKIDETYGANITRDYDIFADGVQIYDRLNARTGGAGIASYSVIVPSSYFVDGSALIRFAMNPAGTNYDPSISSVTVTPVP